MLRRLRLAALERRESIEITGTGVLLLGGVYAFGKFDGRLDQLEKRADALEVRTDPLRALKTGNGELCLKMLDQLNSAKGSRRKELEAQWQRSDCEGVPAAATESTAVP